MKELYGVDFAILMGFAAESYDERNKSFCQKLYIDKLLTKDAKEVLIKLTERYGGTDPSAQFVRKIAGIDINHK